MDLTRRKVLAGLAGLLAAAPACSLGQATPSGKPKRVAICLGPSNAPDPIGPTRKFYAGEFARHGLVDGKDIEIAILRPKSRDPGEFLDPVRRAVEFRADVILAHASGQYAKAKLLPIARGTPLVLWGPDDGSHDTIEELNRRGENVTGVMYSYFELVLKRFELLKELRPDAKRAAIVTPEVPDSELAERVERMQTARLTAEVRALGMEFVLVKVGPDVPADTVVRRLREARVDLAEVLCCSSRELWESLAKSGIAASAVGPGKARDGALLGGWSVGYVEAAVRLAGRVLRGARAASIPVERPREFGLAINLGTARTLGITVPAALLLRAQEVFK